ncbi:type IV-A pilus assembly ATPase PilB [bacterium]|nr:MAG: type IV-A pilus assembly ATPase PilB [bacterium]
MSLARSARSSRIAGIGQCDTRSFARHTLKDKIAGKLLEANLVSQDQLHKALEQQNKEGGTVGQNLVRTGALSELAYTEFLGKMYSLPTVCLAETEISTEIAALIPQEVATRFGVVPVERRGRVLKVAMANPSNIFAIDDIKFITGMEVQPVVAAESEIKAAINKYYDSADSLREVLEGLEDDVELVEDDDDDVDSGTLSAESEHAPVVKLVNSMLVDAVKRGASDVHVECYEKHMRVRYRVDGILQEMMQPPSKMKSAIISRLKIMSELDIAERRIPQDGRIKLKVGEKKIDLRVSTLPCIFGEKIVMRILDKSNLKLDLADFGMYKPALDHILHASSLPYGMLLVTGPTGSGKTTTLYSCLSRVNKPGINIMTAEDPVEYNLDGINQVQVKESVGLTFAAALKAFLRQDPNIVMVGEIRDLETGGIAVKAALTGHLVLSTLHTNDAPATINRMIDMGLEPFLVATSTNLIAAQRLVRRICSSCKTVEDVPQETLADLGIDPEMTCFHGKGCDDCGDTGYRGRQGLYEVLPFTPRIRELILERSSTTELRDAAIEEGMLTLRKDGIRQVEAGVTTVEEILRETVEDQ